MTTIGFIGSGRMGYALMHQLYPQVTSVLASDKNEDKKQRIVDLGATVATNVEIAEQADIIFLCVKPNYVVSVLKDIEKNVRENTIVISIAAGITLETLECALSGKKVVRVMPNTPCLVGEMAAGYTLGTHITKEDEQTVSKLLKYLGPSHKVEEKLIDAVTGLSGSGPAFIAYVTAALIKGAEHEGLSHDVATSLAYQTVLGTAKLMIKDNMTPEELITMVASPGGTTEAGLAVLKEKHVAEALQSCVRRASERSREMGK